MKTLLGTILAPWLLTALGASGSAAPMPVVPITSAMEHWDNHWFIWLPQDPVYEAVEVMSKNDGPGGQPLVWAFFTERAGAKHQVHYVNDKLWARREGWTFVPIIYAVTGEDGMARGLDVRFMDQQRRTVSIHLGVSKSAKLTPAGLTNQIGHSADSIFLMFFRGENTLATDWTVRIGDEVASAPGPAYVAPFRPAYSHDISTALFTFGTTTIAVGIRRAPIDTSLNFGPDASGATYWTPQNGGTRKMLATTPAGELRSYADYDGSHALRIDFSQPLKSPCASDVPMRTPFNISIDGRDSLLTGSVEYRPGPQSRLRWTFDKPDWAAARHLATEVAVDCRLGTERVVVAPQLASERQK